jgi:hypothetical protein
MSQPITSKSWNADIEKTTVLELGDINDGIYLVSIKTSKCVMSRKLLIKQ